MKVVTPFEVAELNTKISEAGISCHVHLTDACGAQSLSLEGEAGACAAARPLITSFFAERGMEPVFTEAGTFFTLK